MPLEKLINIDEQNTLALWRLDESAEELLQSFSLNEEEKPVFSTFVNEGRKKQWLAYRLLLRGLLNDDNLLIRYDENRKPHLVHHPYHISVTHSCHYAGVLVGKSSRVGIDIERITPRIEKIKNRFLNKRELNYLKNGYELEELYTYWCAKEAIYKLYGRKQLDFRENILLEKAPFADAGSFKAGISLNEQTKKLTLHFKRFHDYILVYVVEN